MVAVENRAGTERSQVRTRPRLTHAKGRGHLPTQDRNRPPLLLLLRPEREQGRRDDAHALRVEAVVDASPGQFLAMDELAEDVGVSAAELGWIPRQEPSVVELQPLPATRPLRHVRRRA